MAAKKRNVVKARIARAKRAMSPEARAAYGEVQQGIGHLEKSMREIQGGLRKAERKIEADARARVQALKKDARAQLALLKRKQREAARRVNDLTTAAEMSWQEVKQSADAILADARGTAASIIERLRAALSR
jgi:hypothetical protein